MASKWDDKLKDPEKFNALRRKGYSKDRAAKISNKGAERKTKRRPKVWPWGSSP